MSCGILKQTRKKIEEKNEMKSMKEKQKEVKQI